MMIYNDGAVQQQYLKYLLIFRSLSWDNTVNMMLGFLIQIRGWLKFFIPEQPKKFFYGVSVVP